LLGKNSKRLRGGKAARRKPQETRQTRRSSIGRKKKKREKARSTKRQRVGQEKKKKLG